MRWLRKILKLAGILVLSLLFLLLLIAGIVRIPAVQQQIADKALKFLQQKTGGTYALKSVYIDWPLSISIRELLVEDPKGDTVLYAGFFRSGVNFPALLKGDIKIGKTRLEDAVVFISRSKNDSLYNYDFIVKAFADTAKEDTTSGGSSVHFSSFDLKNIRFSMHDEAGGNFTDVALGEMSLDFSKSDLDSLEFDLNSVVMRNVNAKILLAEVEAKGDTLMVGDTMPVHLPTGKIHDLKLENIVVSYASSGDSSAISANLGNFSLNKGDIDLNRSVFHFGKLKLQNSNLAIYDASHSTTKIPDSSSSAFTFPRVDVEAKEIKIENTSFRTKKANSKKQNIYAFNPDNINIRSLAADIEDVRFNAESSSADINELSWNDSTAFVLMRMQGKMSMNQDRMDLSGLKILTAASSVNADLNVDYENLQAFIENPYSAKIRIDLDIPIAGISDIRYWVPTIAVNDILRKTDRKWSLQLNADGSISSLAINRLQLNYATATKLALTGKISGLPDAKKLQYNIPDLKLSTRRNEIASLMPDSAWPSAVKIPQFLNVNAKLNGSTRSADLKSLIETDAGKLNADVNLKYGRDTAYVAELHSSSLKLNKILGDSSGLGETAFLLKTKGHGFDPDRLEASADLNVDHISVKKYKYRNAKIAADYLAKQVKIVAALDDSALAFTLKGEGNLRKDKEYVKADFNLKGADLKMMNAWPDDLRISARLNADLKGTNADNLNGTAGITKLIIAQNKNTYVLDSLLFASVNEDSRNSMKFSSAVLQVDLDGNVKPGELVTAFQHGLNHYYPFFPPEEHGSPQHFTLDVTFQNHPVLNEVFFRELTDFLPGKIHIDFDNREEKLECSLDVPRVRYAANRIENLRVDLNTNGSRLNYGLSVEELLNGNYGLVNFEAGGNFADKKGNLRIREGRKDDKNKEEKSKKLDAEVQFTGLNHTDHTVHFLSPIELGYETWTAAEKNSIHFSQGKTTFTQLEFTADDQKIAVSEKQDGTEIRADNFDLAVISQVISRDTFPVSGTLNGTINLGNEGHPAMKADATLNSLAVMAVPVGDLELKAVTEGSQAFNFNVALSGNSNDVRATGRISEKDSVTYYDINGDINHLNATILDGFSLGAVKGTTGDLQGDFALSGSAEQPELKGRIAFHNFSTIPSATNVRIYIGDQQLLFKNEQIVFPSFLVYDEQQGTFKIDGDIGFKNFEPGTLDLDVNIRDFLVFNVPRKRDQLYYGKLDMDGRLHVSGNASLPVISAKLTVKDGSDFAVVVPQEELTTDKGQEVVTFRDTVDLHPILIRNEKTAHKQGSGFKGVTLDSRLTINDQARFRLLIDPSTGDSLAVSGAADLAFTMDPAGDITLTGTYNLKGGSYFTSLQDFIQKRFLITEGSTIRWNGDPLDAELDIDAEYKLKTSPADLVSGQVSGLSDEEQSQYKQRLEFLVMLHLEGELLQPDISFKIELAEKDKGSMGGIVETRLQQVNNDPSELNKQVFALLLLNRFVQSDPLASATGSSGAEGLARSSVSRFLTDQLNQLSGQYIGGAEISFDVDSYEDFSKGNPEGRTEVGVAVKKQFLDERFSVQVGGGFDVEGEAAKANQLSDITGDVLVEYKLTTDGRFRASGFRKNEYQDALEGQVTETGAGLLYMRDFNKWKNFFRKGGRARKNDRQYD